MNHVKQVKAMQREASVRQVDQQLRCSFPDLHVLVSVNVAELGKNYILNQFILKITMAKITQVEGSSCLFLRSILHYAVK